MGNDSLLTHSRSDLLIACRYLVNSDHYKLSSPSADLRLCHTNCGIVSPSSPFCAGLPGQATTETETDIKEYDLDTDRDKDRDKDGKRGRDIYIGKHRYRGTDTYVTCTFTYTDTTRHPLPHK